MSYAALALLLAAFTAQAQELGSIPNSRGGDTVVYSDQNRCTGNSAEWLAYNSTGVAYDGGCYTIDKLGSIVLMSYDGSVRKVPSTEFHENSRKKVLLIAKNL